MADELAAEAHDCGNLRHVQPRGKEHLVDPIAEFASRGRICIARIERRENDDSADDES